MSSTTALPSAPPPAPGVPIAGNTLYMHACTVCMHALIYECVRLLWLYNHELLCFFIIERPTFAEHFKAPVGHDVMVMFYTR